MFIRMKFLGLGLLAAWFGVVSARALGPTDVRDFALFGSGGIELLYGANVEGLVGTSQRLWLERGPLSADGVYIAGGYVSEDLTSQNISGDFVVGGNLFAQSSVDPSTIGGNLVVGGNVEALDNSLIRGDYVVSGDGFIPQNQIILGNALVGGDVFLDGTVDGHVTHGGVFNSTSPNPPASVAPGGPVPPPQLGPWTLPASAAFHATDNDVNLANNQDFTLAPGQYGELNFASNTTLTLTAGTYTFQSVFSDSIFNRLNLDTTGGEIVIQIEEDSFLGLQTLVDGADLAETDTADAANILLETAASISMAGSFYGTVFAPNGTIELGENYRLIGSAIAGNDIRGTAFVDVGPLDVTHVRSAILVPEPGAVALLTGLAVIAGVRRRRS